MIRLHGTGRMTAREQRTALTTIIRKTFPDVKVECADLPWLRVPTAAIMSEPLSAILTALCLFRGQNGFATEGRKLICDIVIPSQRIIVEYDERQHFSKPRAIALRLYQQDTAIGFDLIEWISYCERIAAIDNDPPYRDEQRAFYDSVRDILASENGYRVIRLKHGAFDWRSGNANEELMQKISIHSPVADQANPRFATACIQGAPARQYRTHIKRLALMASIVSEIDKRWKELDVVAFPGGFLRLDKTIGSMPYADRVQALDKAGFVGPVRNAIKLLTHSSAAALVFGVDGPKYPNGDRGDQFCVAANRAGIVGVSRKIFPTLGGEANGMLCFDADFKEPHRVIGLQCGRNASLSACYDMFGVAERGNVEGTRGRIIRWIGTYEDQLERGTAEFQTRLKANLASFEEVLQTRKVTVGIAAIHEFSAHNTAFWQRHGVAACSAALNSGFAIGAAHFHTLPQNANSSTLASANAPQRSLGDLRDRQAHSWQPRDHFTFNSNLGSALVRLFC